MNTPRDQFHHASWSLSDEAIINVHINGSSFIGSGVAGIPKDFYYISTLGHALREMNGARGRIDTQFLIPLLAAFAILDQMGECYGFVSKLVDEPASSIKRAIHHFQGARTKSALKKLMHCMCCGMVLCTMRL